jgi:hypothetical protein
MDLPILAIGIPVCMISTTACTADFTSGNGETNEKLFHIEFKII